MKHLGISEVAVLTGDRGAAARAVAKRVHIKNVEAELLPAGKAVWIEGRQKAGRRVAMVGDGINDAPALAKADVGIALGAMGSDLAAEAGDLVILGEPLANLPDLVKLSRATVAIIRQNILIFAFGLNALAMGSAALGLLGPIPAAILHQAGSFLVLLNSMRLLWFGDWTSTAPVRGLRAVGRSIRRLDDRLDPAFAFDRLLSRWRVLVALVVLILISTYATWGWTAIGPGEVGLLRRFGKFSGVLEPGLHLRLPPPIETITRLAPGMVRSVEVGFRSGSPGTVGWESPHNRGNLARADDEALLITGDGQLVEIAATAEYRLDPTPQAIRAFAFGAVDPEAALRPLAESTVRSIVGRRGLDDLLTRGRLEAEMASKSGLQERVDASKLGLVISAVSFQDVHPPLPVVDAYRDVSRAESDRLRKVTEGITHRETRLATAEALAVATIQKAGADRDGRAARASGESDSFLSRVGGRDLAPSLTDHRLYWETIASAFRGRDKVRARPLERSPTTVPARPARGTPADARALTSSPCSSIIFHEKSGFPRHAPPPPLDHRTRRPRLAGVGGLALVRHRGRDGIRPDHRLRPDRRRAGRRYRRGGVAREVALAIEPGGRPPAPGVRPSGSRDDHGGQAQPGGGELRGLAGGRPPAVRGVERLARVGGGPG